MIALPWGWLEEMVRVAIWISPLMAGLLLVRPWLQRWIGGRGMALVWSVVILRLLIPTAWTIPQKWKAEVREVVERKEAVLGGKATEMQGASYEVTQSGAKPDRAFLWGAVWLAGMAGVIGWTLLGVVRLSRMRTGPMRNQAVLDAWVEIDEALRGSVSLRSCGELAVPALVGRAIWIPERWQLSRAQWRHVLLHELGHARRGDLWMQWAGVLATALYWWNPLVWLSARAAAADREVACDEWVQRKGEAKEEYGATLIALSRRVEGGGSPVAVLMATGRKQLLQRVEAMAAGPVAGWRGMGLAALMLMGVLGLTARAGSGGDRTPWSEQWRSAPYLDQLRLEDAKTYHQLKELGGVVAEARFYQLPEETSQGVLQKLATSEDARVRSAYATVLPLTEEEVKSIDASLYRELTLPFLIAVSGEEKHSTLQRMIYHWPDGDSNTKPDVVKGVGIGFVVGMTASETKWTCLIQLSVTELIGVQEFFKTGAVEPMPWNERLLDRVIDFPAPSPAKLPVIKQRTVALKEWEVSPDAPAYFLMRLFPIQDNGVADAEMRHLRRRAQAQEPLADYPANALEYWVVVRLSPIPPAKP